MKKLRILIADDHGLVRRGAREVLHSRRGWRVVGEAANGREAVRKAKELKPDVAAEGLRRGGDPGDRRLAKEVCDRAQNHGRQTQQQEVQELAQAGQQGEDAQQETLLKAHRNLRQFEGRARFTTWISRIAINESLMSLRRRRDGSRVPFEI